MKQLAVIFLLNLIISMYEVNGQSSPCPNIFQYQTDGERNYGIITIPGPGVGRTIMQAHIAIRGPVYNRGTGGLSLLKPLDSAVVDAKRGRDIQYILNFPQSQQWPTIMRLTLNNINICRGPDVYNAPTWTFQHEFTYPSGLTHLSSIPFRNPNPPEPVPERPRRPPPTLAPPPPAPVTPTPQPRVPPVGIGRPSDVSWLDSLPFAGTCGRKPEPTSTLQATQLIIGGVDVEEGEFPWMVAMFHFIARSMEYKCAGSLISNTYVITAAHCTVNQSRVFLELGRHNIHDRDENGYVSRLSMQIINHPEYVSGAHADVALILIERIEFTAKIKPICLWAHGANFDNAIKHGTVTGWGRIENDGASSSTPMKLEVRTVGLDTCRASNDKLRNIATDDTFCAGGMNSGPCHGDSGSGFYFQHGKVWYLRGIISTSIGNSFACNLEIYAVYVELSYYLDWLRPYLS